MPYFSHLPHSCPTDSIVCRCTTKGLGTGCYPKKVADYLPEALFTCDKPSDACVKQKTEETCGDEKGCSWCVWVQRVLPP